MADKQITPAPLLKTSSANANSQRTFNFGGKEGDEVEIAAQLSLPHEGGWGWVIVATSFLIIGLVDGVVFSFGSIIINVTREFNVPDSIGGLINASTLAIYSSAGPLVSALINRFGFRACCMGGSVLSAFTVFFCYFVDIFVVFYIFYGFVAGFGYCCIQMATTLVVPYYFQQKRALAMSLSVSGSCFGIMIMSPLNVYIVSKCNWRTVLLMQAGFLGIIYFISMAFRPLLSVTVVTTVDDKPSKSVAVLPPVGRGLVRDLSNSTLKPSRSEAFFQAASNVKYPTAANVVASPSSTNSQKAGPSAPSSTKLVVKSTTNVNEIGRIQQKQLMQLGPNIDVEQVDKKRRKKVVCFEWCCQWEEHVSEQRPMYRDDVFYEGPIKRLEVYQKSVANIPESEKTGIEYQLAVSRAVAVDDLKEKKGFLTKSVRRVLATMLDVTLLQRFSFILVCLTGFLCFFGYLIPFLCSFDRAVKKGLDPNLSKYLVSVISFSILVGRLTIGLMSDRFNPVYLCAFCHLTSGAALVCSNFYFVLWYQFLMSGIFGLFGGLLATLRSLVLVELYGLDKLTNATGLILLFSGIGSLVGAPCLIALSQALNIELEFYIAGLVFILGGVIFLFVTKISKKENVKLNNLDTNIAKNV